MTFFKRQIMLEIYFIFIIFILCSQWFLTNKNFNLKHTYSQFKTKHSDKIKLKSSIEVAINLNSSIEVAIVIPFKNRYEQLTQFTQHMCKFWGLQEMVLNVYVVNQLSQESFRRAWLFNVGCDLTKILFKSETCVVLHDIDLLPLEGVDYKECQNPRHISSEAENFGWSIPYNSFSGGVFSASWKHWKLINGMSNLFLGWGGEDDELFERWKIANMTKTGDTPYRSKAGHGKFKKNFEYHFKDATVDHEYNENVQLIHDLRNGKRHYLADGLQQVQYKLITRNETLFENCSLRVVQLNVDK